MKIDRDVMADTVAWMVWAAVISFAIMICTAGCAPSVPIECVLVDFADFSEEPILSADLVINGVENEELAAGIVGNLFCAGPHKQLEHKVVCRLPKEGSDVAND